MARHGEELLAADLVLDSIQGFATHDPDEAHETISRLFCPHTLSVLDAHADLDMTLRSLHHGHVGLDFLDYGTDVRISPGALEDFFLVQIPLSGSAAMTVGTRTHLSDPGIASVPPVDQDFSMVWRQGTPHLIVYAERRPLEALAASLYGPEAARDLRLDRALDLTAPAGSAFLQFVRSYHDDLNSDSPAMGIPFARKLLNETLMARLLLAVGNTAAEATRGHGSPGPGGSRQSRLVTRFERMLADHAQDPISIVDIANALNVPLRTLQYTVRHELGVTPSERLHEVRLDLVQARLLTADPAVSSVTEIAAGCGFMHLGRFASSYHAAYGEYPSATLRR
jgi:AraC-like DNA-binding protein